jgi:ppGpp synthetase/RelA/SpoT-type nucleotidyltranferase
MDIIKNENIIINELVKIYSEEELQEDLKLASKTISNSIKTVLIEKGEKQGLITKNSVRDIKYFSLVSRIKEPESLREKFYRGNLLTEDFKTFNFKKIKDVVAKRNDVKTTFKKSDDVIGVKVLTDLNEDCKKVLTILKDNEAFLEQEGITLDKKDLGKQPTIMQNGLEIYKIKGGFKKSHSFELQIKSKIVSAWGDMEHAIFYKDYFISPVRESTKATMNHIGKLLFQIDDFLVSVRNANKEFVLNLEANKFMTWFDITYSKKISTKLGGVGYKVDTISEALFCIYSTYEIQVRELSVEHFNLKVRSEYLKYYLNIRNKSYDLKIFESIVFGWFWRKNQITKNSIDNKLEQYLDTIIYFLAKKIIEKNQGLELQDATNQINYYFTELLKYNPKASIFLNEKDYLKHYSLMAFVKGELELAGKVKYYKVLDLLLLNKKMNGDLKEQIKDLQLDSDIISQYREILDQLVREIKMEDKKDFEKEIDNIKEIITELK